MSETDPTTALTKEVTPPVEDAADSQADTGVARLFDAPISAYPEDLYIPPDALRVFLDAFEGPLDLLLYLIRRHNLDILNVNVAIITRQYIDYIDVMQAMEIELAGEYLLMAAMLAEIKSRTLLPRTPRDGVDEEEDDPRAELIRRLQAYEHLKHAAESLDDMPRNGRDWFAARATLPSLTPRVIHPSLGMEDLLDALSGLLKRADLVRDHQVSRETFSTRERMLLIMDRLGDDGYQAFETLFRVEEGRAGIVVTFMAILELTREAMIEIVQNAPLAPIHVRRR